MSVIARDDLSGRGREVALRDRLFLETAKRIVVEEGYHALTITRLADEMRLSRPTVYERFSSKEGVLAELALNCQREVLALLQETARIEGRPRERLIALGEALRLYSQWFWENMQITTLIREQSVAQRMSEQQRQRISEQDEAVFTGLVRIVEEAVAAGDLTLPEDTCPEALCLAIWSMFTGGFTAARGAVPYAEKIGIGDTIAELVANAQRLFDGYGWQPLSNEWDFSEIRNRVREQIATRDWAGVIPLESGSRRDKPSG